MTKMEFADRIDEFASGRLDGPSWEQFFVAHYADETIEAARRDVVRVAIKTDGGLSNVQAEEVRGIAVNLREEVC